MTEQDQTPRPDDDTMGHARPEADDTTGDDDAKREADDTTDDDDDTMGHGRHWRL
jgi:hypothetical protein